MRNRESIYKEDDWALTASEVRKARQKPDPKLPVRADRRKSTVRKARSGERL